MASVTSGVSTLSLIGYAVLAILLAYLGLWVYRHLRSNVQSRFSLPNPVSGSSHKASTSFKFGYSTGQWNWRRWSLPRVPTWPKVPDAVIGKAKSVANAKNLNVELLPTTALPPPPTSVPTPGSASLPTTQLIDVSGPTTPPLTTGSTSGSFPISPRTPSPPFMHHTILSKPLHQSPMFTSYSRSPSPLSNLATYPQKSHRRSKSLGGVPIRRLSGGSSGLRNAMEMRDFSPSHTRGTSREHLLIDFASSSSSDEDETEGGFIKISPAASDIGILPAGKEIPPRVDARSVGRHVPLVDLDDENADFVTSAPRATTHDEEEAWKWFISSTMIPATQPGPRLTESGAQVASHPGGLIDVLGKQMVAPAPGAIPIDLRQMELGRHREERELVDIVAPKPRSEVETKESILVNVKENDLDEDLPLASLNRSLNIKQQEQIVEAPRPRSPESPLVIKAAFSHPLETLVDVGTTSSIDHDVAVPFQDDVQESSAETPSLLFQPEPIRDGHGIPDSHYEVMDPFADPVVQPSTTSINPEDLGSLSLSPKIDLVDRPFPEVWAWDMGGPADDPWANHTSNETFSTSPATPNSDVFLYTGMDAPVESEQRAPEDLITFEAPSLDSAQVFVYEPEAVVLEKSPGATLFATELVDEEGEMPALDLTEGLSELTEPQTLSEIPKPEPNYPDEEEDTTPKPTPAPVELKLPALVDNIVDDEDDRVSVSDAVHPEFELNVSQVDSGLYTGDYADPDLLPLPDSTLFKIEVPDPELPSWLFDKVEDGKRSTPSQTPTPPASPPPISPLRVVSTSNGMKSTLPSPGGHAVAVMSSLMVSPPPSLTLVIGHSPKTSTVVPLRELEDKENVTPVALSSTSSKSILGVKPEMVSPSEPTPESPRQQRRILGDIVPATSDVEADTNETKLETILLSTVDQEQKVTVKDRDLQPELELERPSSSLPGTFPETVPTVSKSATATTLTTVGARLASASNVLTPLPSSRALARSPLDIALAMQLRPGLGVGADPAWMVRFLMAMFGWFAVVVSGQAEF